MNGGGDVEVDFPIGDNPSTHDASENVHRDVYVGLQSYLNDPKRTLISGSDAITHVSEIRDIMTKQAAEKMETHAENMKLKKKIKDLEPELENEAHERLVWEKVQDQLTANMNKRRDL